MIYRRMMFICILAQIAVWDSPAGADETLPGSSNSSQVVERQPPRDVSGAIALGKRALLSLQRNPAGMLTLLLETKSPGHNKISGRWMLNESEQIKTLASREDKVLAVINYSRPDGLHYSGILMIEKDAKSEAWKAYRCLDSKALGESKDRRIWIEDVKFEGEKKGEFKFKIATYVTEGKDAGVVKRDWVTPDPRSMVGKILLDQRNSKWEKIGSNERSNGRAATPTEKPSPPKENK